MNSNILSIAGGKFYTAKQIIPYFPPHKIYVEPFCGAAHVLLKKSPSDVEVIADNNWNLINLYQRVGNESVQSTISRFISITDRDESLELKNKWQSSSDSLSPDIRAALYFYLQNSSYGGMFLHNPGVESFKKKKGYKFNNIPRFLERTKNVNFICTDFETTIKMFDSPNTLFYCDPPYSLKNDKYFDGCWTQSDDVRLSQVLHSIEGKFSVTYYPNEFILKLYKDCKIVELQSNKTLDYRNKANNGAKRREVLFLKE